MKNDRIIASWNKIEPDEPADQRMLSAILERNRSVQNGKDKANHMSKTVRILIPAAACMALLIAAAGIMGAKMNWFGNKPDAGAGSKDTVAGANDTVDRAGTLPEGIDPIAASVAVYPADRSLSDIADAVLKELTEEEAYGVEGLSGHLPSAVIDGYRFKNASLYETTMKDGSKYRMLRVFYTTGDRNIADYFVQLTNFRPRTEAEIYASDSIPGNISGFFNFERNGVYFGMRSGALSYDDIMTVVNSID